MSDVAAENLVPDLEEARRFLHALEAGGRFQFQVFDDTKKTKAARHAGLFGSLDQLAGELTKLNNQRMGIFVTVNRCDGHGRDAGNVTGLRAFFVDGDDAGPLPTEWHLPPSMIVQRGAAEENHWHAYWFLDPVPEKGEFEAFRLQFRVAQKRLHLRYKSDHRICDLPRVMRLPGFWHQKAEPKAVRIVSVDATLRYAAETILNGLPEWVEGSAISGGGVAFSRAGVAPATGGRSEGGKLPKLSGELTENGRAERYALVFPQPARGAWNNSLTDLVTNLCSHFGGHADEAAIFGAALQWSLTARPEKEVEGRRTIESAMAFCKRSGLWGNQWRAAKVAGGGRPLPEFDGTEARFEEPDYEADQNAHQSAHQGQEAVEVQASDASGSGCVPETNTGGSENDRRPADVAEHVHGSNLNADTSETEIDGQCEEPDADDAAAGAVSETEPGTILPKLAVVPDGDVAEWLDGEFEERLADIGRFEGTKRDRMVLELLREVAKRLVGVASVTVARIKSRICKKLDMGKREYDRAMDEAILATLKSAGSGYMQLARDYVEYLRKQCSPSRVWRYWRQEWYEWRFSVGCYLRQEDKWVEAEVTKWLSAQGVEPTGGVLSDFFVSMRALSILHSDILPGTWLGEHSGREGNYLALRNGILNLEKRELGLMEHTPDYWTLHATEFDFDPQAECPLWQAATETWQPPATSLESWKLLQDWLGYIFVKYNPRKKFMICTGPGNDGKSVYARICREIVGERNCSAVGLDSFDPSQTFGLEPMIGKMLNIIPDANMVERVAEGTLKTLTGNDPHTFPRKNISAITEVWPGKIMICANAVPYWRDRSEAMFNRMLPLHWEPIPPDKVDEHLVDKLKGELSGIFNWAMVGFDDIRKRDFHRVGRVTDWLEEARHETQPELDFFNECIDVDMEKGSLKKLYMAELIAAYVEHSKSMNKSKAFCHDGTLGKQLRAWLKRKFKAEGVAADDAQRFLDDLAGRDSSGPRKPFLRGLILLRAETVNTYSQPRWSQGSFLQ